MVAAVLPPVVLLHYLTIPETAGAGGKVLFSLQQLPQWCRLASMALGSLPALAQLAESLPPSHPQRDEPSTVALALLQISTDIAAEAANLALHAVGASVGSQPLGVTDPEAASQAQGPLWQLHSTACRLAHSSGLFQRLPGLQPEQAVCELVELLDHVLAAAVGVWCPTHHAHGVPKQ